jgi:hypothetical protein
LSVRLNFAIDKTNAIILLPDCSLVATASSANIVLSGAVLQKILPNHTTNLQIGTSHDATKLQTTPNLGEQTQANSKYPELETIFGKRVLSTIFFDQIKGKLAKVFLLGTPCKALNKFFVNSKWVEAMLENKPMFVGVIYKDNFAYAVGVGENVTNLLATTMPPNYYQIEDKTYKIDFFSAESGKTISRICQN